MSMHIYQKAIIDKLRGVDSLRYSELLPYDIESSHFKYHLDQLIKDHVVERRGRGVYGLSEEGKAYVDRLSENRITPQLMPKLITYTLLQDDDNYYLYKKPKAPYRDLLNMVGGKVHFGENSDDAAVREVYEKTGISLPDVTLYGIADIQVFGEEKLASHVTAYVYGAVVSGPEQQLVTVAKQTVTQQENLAPDFLSLLALIKEESHPFVAQLRIRM